MGKARAWCVTCAATGKWRRGVRPAKPISATSAARLIGKDGIPHLVWIMSRVQRGVETDKSLVEQMEKESSLKCHAMPKSSLVYDSKYSRTVNS